MGSDMAGGDEVPSAKPTSHPDGEPTAHSKVADSKVLMSPKPKGRPKREPKVDIGSPDWKYEDLVLSEEYFRDECGLKGVGIGSWKENGVDTKKLEEVYKQKKDASNGFVVPKTDPCFPWDTVVNLCQVIDGLVKTPVNGRMGVALARRLYFEFKLFQDVNWAKFAHDKHLNQLRSHWRSMAPKPTEAPYIRTRQRFQFARAPAHPLGEEQELYEAAPVVVAPVVKDVPDVTVGDDIAEGSSEGDLGTEAFPDLITPEKKVVLCETEEVKTPSLPDSFQTRIQVAIRGAVKKEERLLQSMRDDMDEARRQLTVDKQKMAHATQVRNSAAEDHRIARENVSTVEEQIAEFLEMKKENAMELERLCETMETNEDPAEAKRLEEQVADCHSQEIELDKDMVEHSQSKEAYEKDVKDGRVKMSTASRDELLARAHLTASENKVEEISTMYGLENDHYLAQLEVQRFCDQLAAFPSRSLHPKGIPTALDIGIATHKVTACPRCTLGFHCSNWVPTPCGHSYHPHCLAAMLQESCSALSMISPACLSCKQLFHPDWMLAWGFTPCHSEVKELEAKFNSPDRRNDHFGNIVTFYTGQASVAAKVFKGAESNRSEPFIPQAEYMERSSADFLGRKHQVRVLGLTDSYMDKSDGGGGEDRKGRTEGASTEKSDDCVVLDGQSVLDGGSNVDSVGHGKRKASLSSSQPTTAFERRKSARHQPLECQTTDESPSDTKVLKTKGLCEVATPVPKKSSKAVSRRLN